MKNTRVATTHMTTSAPRIRLKMYLLMIASLAEAKKPLDGRVATAIQPLLRLGLSD